MASGRCPPRRARQQPPGLTPVGQECAHVSERVTGRRELPVEDGRDLGRLRSGEHHVAEVEVAVDKTGRRRRRPGVHQLGEHVVEQRERVHAGALPLLLPAAQLALHEGLGPDQVTQPDGRGVDTVQGRQRIDDRQSDGAGDGPVEGGHLVGRRVHDAIHVLHHVEGRSDHAGVFAGGNHRRDGHGGVGEGPLDPELAEDVVRRRQGARRRGAPQHPVVEPVAHAKGQVGRPARQALDDQVARLQPGVAQPAGQRRRRRDQVDVGDHYWR